MKSADAAAGLSYGAFISRWKSPPPVWRRRMMSRFMTLDNALAVVKPPKRPIVEH
jgi:hypothetical protein